MKQSESKNYSVTLEHVDGESSNQDLKYNIRIVDTKTCNEYVGSVDFCFTCERTSREHPLFARDRIKQVLDHLIDKHKYIINQAQDDDNILTIEFNGSVSFATCSINDTLAIPCTRVVQNNNTRRIALLERTIEQLNAQLNTSLASNLALSRSVGIQSLISDAEHIFGAIPYWQYDFARMIFAAEFDNSPIIFPLRHVYGLYSMPWLRCVICVTITSEHFDQYWYEHIRCKRHVLRNSICSCAGIINAYENFDKYCDICNSNHPVKNVIHACKHGKIETFHQDVQEIYIHGDMYRQYTAGGPRYLTDIGQLISNLPSGINVAYVVVHEVNNQNRTDIISLKSNKVRLVADKTAMCYTNYDKTLDEDIARAYNKETESIDLAKLIKPY